MKKISLVTIFSLLLFAAYAQSINLFPVQATTQNGVIEGNFDTKSGVQKFFGIPFAKPPVGDLRWKVPQPVVSWKGVKETKTFGARPVQGIVFGDMMSRSSGMSEDCLTLNVWTPASKAMKNLPVLLYFYGGGNVAGDASEPRYDGESMAKKGVVVVTCNYRLGIFGNFAHSELSAETSYKGSGNYGYYDQIAAMQWIQTNIAAFGGDPKHVTIAGESAGSISVSYQMVSPLAKGLFHAAIGESGSGLGTSLGPSALVEAEKTGAEFLQKAGIKSVKELRSMSTAEIYQAYADSKRFGFPVVIDNNFLVKKMPETFIAKEQAQVPLLVGWNSAEIPAAGMMMGKPMTVENYVGQVKTMFPNDADEVLSYYPGRSEKEAELSATTLISDQFLVYSTWKWFDLHRKNSSQPVYRYLYSKLRPPLVDQSTTPGLAGGTLKKSDAPTPPPAVGAPHASEIEYAMGNLHLVKEYEWTSDDFKASDAMCNYFTNFVKTYNPNGEKLADWPAAKADDATPPVMIIDANSHSEKGMNDKRFLFLDKIYTKK